VRILGLTTANDCFFCLSNVNLAKHLIVSIGTDAYVALAKGPLTLPEKLGLPYPGHVLIVPIAHKAFLNASETAEMESYRLRATKLFESRNCDTVVAEFRYREGIHTITQVIAIPKGTPLEEEFVQGFKAKGMTLEKREPGESEEYCRMILPEGTFVGRLPVRFDLQLPRRLLVRVLGLGEREDWRACIQPEDEERQGAAAFRKEFESISL
jgi:hypothetical protein